MKQCNALLLAVCLALCLTACGSSFYDENAKAGLLDGHSEEEIAALRSQTVAEGMLQVSINGNPVFLNGESAGNLRIENAPGNPYDMRVSIVITDGDGETREVYASGGIKPDHHIESAPLSVDLEAGEYAATAKFYAVGKDHKDIGVVSRDITLTVLE